MDTKNDSKNIEKLKELEANIARELDQKVTLSEPTDPRLDGSVQLNPSLQVKPIVPAPTEAPKASVPAPVGTVQTVNDRKAQEKPINSDRKVDDITLEEVDLLLSEEDQNFGTVMSDVKTEVGGIQYQPGMESISIGADILKEAEAEDAEEEIKIELSDQVVVGKEFFEESEVEAPPESSKNVWTYLMAITVSTLKLPIELSIALAKQFMEFRILPPKQVFTDSVGILKSVFQIRLELIKEFLTYLAEFNLLDFVKAGLLVLLISGLYFIVQDIKNFNKSKIIKDPFLKSFEEVASQKEELVENKNEVDKIPQYVISLPRIVANLKPLTPRRESMIAVELYIEASERESIVELKNRQKEVRDLVARVLEQMTYYDLDSIEGKEKLKLRIKLALNQFLNNGRVQTIFFKSIQISQ